MLVQGDNFLNFQFFNTRFDFFDELDQSERWNIL